MLRSTCERASLRVRAPVETLASCLRYEGRRGRRVEGERDERGEGNTGRKREKERRTEYARRWSRRFQNLINQVRVGDGGGCRGGCSEEKARWLRCGRVVR